MMKGSGYCKYLVFVLLAGYLSTTYSITSNKHYHILPNGKIVYHVHPFGNDNDHPIKNHTHTPDETIDFQCNTFDFFESSSPLVNNIISKFYFEVNPVYTAPVYTKIIHYSLSLRAPPVTFS
jgi:hypothetical protein